ncbi:small GTP-binding domain protein [Nitzschia inconspicua]|uniref:Small GTP-binding domain protein n=1 Tax=Nitzschia inconspicua TaxID=303405 RepID=A0A9K3Q7X1_9STRA|nr:small GTP-binding domain protein [Nitzschia inconspicua]
MGLLTILKKVKEDEKEIRLLILGLDNAGKTSITKKFLGQPVETVEPTLGFSIQTLDYIVRNSNSGSREHTNGLDSDTTKTAATETIAEGEQEQKDNNNDNDNNEKDTTTTTIDHGAIQQCISTNNAVPPAAFSNCHDDEQLYRLHLWDIGGQSSIRAYWRNYFEKTDGLIFVIDSSDKHRMELVQEELSTLLQQERLQGATLLVLANKQDLKNALTSDEIATELGLNSKIQYRNRHWAIYGCSAMSGQGLPEALEWLVQDITSRIFLF